MTKDQIIDPAGMSDLEKLCLEKGMRMTDQRRVIARVMSEAKDHPDVDQALCFEKKSWFQQLGFYWRLFANRYDVVIDMHEGTRGAVMCFVTQARFRVGHKFAKRSFLYNVQLEFSDLAPKYPVDYQVALIKKLGAQFARVSERA